MFKIYQFAKSNPSRAYLYARVAMVFTIVIVYSSQMAGQTALQGRISLIGLMVALFLALFWGALFSTREFDPTVARILHLFDVVLISAILYPVAYISPVFLMLPVLFVLSVFTFHNNNDRTVLLTAFFGSFILSEIVFKVGDVIQASVWEFVGQLALLTLITVVVMVADSSINNLLARTEELKQQTRRLDEKKKMLERDLHITRQNKEILNKDVRRKDIEIQNILALSGQLSIREDAQKVLASFLLTAVGQIGCVHAAILTRQNKSQNFISLYVHKGLRNVDHGRIRIYLDSNLIQVLNATREPMLASQIPTEGLFNDEVALLELFENDLLCPIYINNHLAGILVIGRKISGAEFDREDVNLVSIIANQTSFVLEQTQLAADYRDFYAKTLRAMLQSLESRYIYARGHNVRTANYVNLVSRKIGLQIKEVKDLSYGTLLHDIGKVVVLDKYLLDDTRINNGDTVLKEKILEHTVVGSKILKSAGFNRTIVDMAMHHHEFYDGSGYPHQLSKNEISIGSRILSVCNAYDAMTSDRPYRKALSQQAARENMLHQSGNKFDPNIVNAFIDELEHNKKMFRYH